MKGKFTDEFGTMYIGKYKVPPHLQAINRRILAASDIQGRNEVCFECIDSLVSTECGECIMNAPAEVRNDFIDPRKRLNYERV